MHDRGDHYLGNNAWASSGDGVASDNWELAGGRPRPASPALSLVSDNKPPAPAKRPIGSVQKQPVLGTSQRPTTKAESHSASLPSTSSFPRSSKHRVFQSLQRDKLLMGGERELSQINITITMLLGLLAIMGMNWHLAVVAVLFGGPVQWAIRILSERDPDYVKTYLEGLTSPHIREPE